MTAFDVQITQTDNTFGAVWVAEDGTVSGSAEGFATQEDAAAHATAWVQRWNASLAQPAPTVVDEFTVAD